MKILLRTLSHGIGLHLIDAWHAYIQHLNNYSNNIEYILRDSNDNEENIDCDLSILFDYMGNQITGDMIKAHDIVLICNGGEPVAISSPDIKELLKHKNVFLIANAYLTRDHKLKNKVIWFPHNVQTCRDYWTRHFYPQYFDCQNWKKNKKTDSIIYINGANRSPRQLFIDYLQDLMLDLKIKNNLTSQIAEIGESQWESVEDSEFRLWVNQQYNSVLRENHDNPYYNNSPAIGIHEKFGKIPPGYFLLPLYFENFCVVFPESNWQNNELCITEKALKCFYAEALPLPVSGANVNQLYNDLGFYTAWNLLPQELQKFDSILHHNQRYVKLSQAVEWLIKNPEVFTSEKYTKMIEKNKINFLTCNCDYRSVIDFDHILSQFIKNKHTAQLA
jgi:hypothetical protein